MSVVQKIKVARLTYPGRPTQAVMGEMLNMSEKKYQSYELGKVKTPAKLEPFIENAARIHGISKDWFWDGVASDPIRSSDPLLEIKVPVYHAPAAMALIAKEDRIRMLPIDADVASEMGGSKGVELPDERMSPRFNAGTRLFGRPVDLEDLKFARMYTAIRKPKNEDDSENEIVVGVYQIIEGIWVLAPINSKFDFVNVLDLRDFTLIIACQHVLEGDPDWVLNEKRLNHGLPTRGWNTSPIKP